MTSPSVKLQSGQFKVVVAYESPSLPDFDPRSADNVVMAEREVFLGDRSYRPSSRHRVSILHGNTAIATRILCAVGGATGVHDHSVLVRGDVCCVAVGPFVCALRIPDLALAWQTEVDGATCFGIYDAPAFQSIISHGECEIARLDYDGNLIWSSGGRDIFTEGFSLFDEHIDVVDFEGQHYRFDILSGRAQTNSA